MPRIKTKLFLFSSIFVMLFFVVDVSQAATRYANSSTGVNTGDCTDSGNPCKTFTYTYSQAVGGDTINLTGTFDWVNGTGGTAETTSTTSGFTLAKNITITGQGADQTFVQANSSSTSGTNRRVFTISAGYTVTIQDLTIRYGYTSSDGGGIRTQSALTVDDCVFSYNRSSSGSGGAIQVSDAQLIVQDSTFNNNYASSQGGAIQTDYYTAHTGTADIINSTIVFNTAAYGGGTVGGGGVCFRGSGGTITNSTIAYNDVGSSSYGAGVYYYPSLAGSTLTIQNSIIASNTRGSASLSSSYNGDVDGTSGTGTITDNGNNIIGYNYVTNTQFTVADSSWIDAVGSASLDGTFTRTSPVGSGSLYLDTILQTNNSSNGTKTLAIALDTSIAINNGSESANGSISIPATDQRGVSRISTTDIGAYEFDSSYVAETPATQATNVSFSAITSTAMTVSWTNGSGANRIVFAKQASEGTVTPVDNTDYTAITTFGSGTAIEDGDNDWYCVYSGTGTSVAVTGLSPSTNYIVQVFEYNGAYSGIKNYLTTQSTGNPNSQASHTPVTLYANSSTGVNTGDCTDSGNPCKTFTYTYSQAVSGDTIDLTGTFDWVNGTGGTAETTSTTSGFTLAKNITITGQGAGETIVQANSSSTSGTNRRVFTISAGYTVTIQDLTIRYGYTSSDGGGIRTQSALTVDDCVFSYNRSSSGSGGAIQVSDAQLIVQDSTFNNNYASSQGGAIQTDYYTAHTGTADIINSTIVFNTAAYGGGTVGGGGVCFRGSGGTITNSTIAYNDVGSSSYGAGVFYYPSLAGSTLTIQNSIIAGNTRGSNPLSSSYNGDVDMSGSNGTITDNGNNVIGYNYFANTAFTIASSSWVDSTSGALDGTFARSSPEGSGSLYLDTSLASNSTLNGTNTIALTNINSIARDNGSSSSNGSISIPTIDQRALARDGSPDIGSYEYQADTTAPTITSISSSKANGTYKAGEIVDIDITFSEAVTSTGNVTATLETGGTDRSCTFTVTNSTTGTCNYTVQAGDISADLDATISGTIADQSSNAMANFTPTTSLATSKAIVIDTTAPSAPTADPAAGTYTSVQSVTLSSTGSSAIYYTINGDEPTTSSTLYSTVISVGESQTIKALAVDLAGNESSVLSAAYVINLDSEDPILSSITAYTSENGAIITWSTNENSSALVNYGLTSSCAVATSESDTSPRDTDHSVTISGLITCTRYYYKAQSTDGYTNTGYSSVGTFKTSGCTGDATVTATGQDTITTAGGGSLNQGNITLTIPTSFTNSAESVVFQANQIDSSSFSTTAGTPTGYTQVGTDVYTLRALSDESTAITSFDSTITITINYSDSDISIIDESSLWIYRYDGSNWHALSGCSVDTSANTVTCTTTSFSDFAIFGEEGVCSTIEHAATYNAYPTCGPATCNAGYNVSNGACVATGGGGLPADAYKLPTIPAGGFKILINNEAEMTQDRNVILTFNAGLDVKKMAISNTGDFVNSGQENYTTQKEWVLSAGDGRKTVYVKFYTSWGQSSEPISASIFLNSTENTADAIKTLIEQLKSQIVALQSQIETMQKSDRQDTSNKNYQFTNDLYLGITGEDVKQLQIYLNNNGFILVENGDGSLGSETEFFGNLTKIALIKFQKANNIDPAYGFFGPITRTFINALSK